MNDLELYIHIPFCVKKCDYCDFLSAPADRNTQKSYVDALIREIEASGREHRVPGRNGGAAENSTVPTIFIGGGTPSILEGAEIWRIMDQVRRSFHVATDAEITMEANPGTLTAEKLTAYRSAGINRLSLGLQSTDDRELKALGRIHTYRDFLESYSLARQAGFSNINVDLMSAIPGQTCEGWKNNLRTLAELEPEHISAYSLIVEEGTPFADRELKLPDEEEEYRMYEDTAEILREYGYIQYEISNYAKDAKPAFACRHNIGYWRRTPYLGLGLGASSLLRRTDAAPETEKEYRFRNTRDFQEYLRFAAEPRKLRREIQKLTEGERQEEFMFLGLRMTEGVSEVDFERDFGRSLTDVYGTVLNKYREMGFLACDDDRWFFTRKGIHVSNRILADFLQD